MPARGYGEPSHTRLSLGNRELPAYVLPVANSNYYIKCTAIMQQERQHLAIKIAYTPGKKKNEKTPRAVKVDVVVELELERGRSERRRYCVNGRGNGRGRSRVIGKKDREHYTERNYY